MRKTLRWCLLCTATVGLLLALVALGQISPQIGREVAMARHLQDGEEFDIPIPQLVQYGSNLFSAKFSRLWLDEWRVGVQPNDNATLGQLQGKEVSYFALVFQQEADNQIAYIYVAGTPIPRLKPRCEYDLVPRGTYSVGLLGAKTEIPVYGSRLFTLFSSCPLGVVRPISSAHSPLKIVIGITEFRRKSEEKASASDYRGAVPGNIRQRRPPPMPQFAETLRRFQ